MIRTCCRVVCRICCLLAIAAVAAPAAAGERTGAAMSLQMLDAMPADPLLAGVVRIENPETIWDQMLSTIDRFVPEEKKATVDQSLQQIDEKLGLSLRNDLLAVIGPELGLVVDLPPIDQMAGMFMEPTPESVAAALGRIGLLCQVRDAKKLDGTLRQLFLKTGAEITQEEKLVRITFPAKEDSSDPDVSFFYGHKDQLLVFGFDAGWITGSLQGQAKGQRLRDGADFQRVAGHLDMAPSFLYYINLPKIRNLVAESQMVQGALTGNEEANQVASVLLDPATAPMGLAGTVQLVDGGMRKVSYGPSWLAGGTLPGVIAAIAIPNMLTAVDRGRQKRTMADLRSIGTCMEAFAVDNDVYPSTDGEWVDVTTIADQLAPVYIQKLPATDGWDNPFRLWSDGASYLIVSKGEDGELEQAWTTDAESVQTDDPAADIVYSNGAFLRYPGSSVSE